MPQTGGSPTCIVFLPEPDHTLHACISLRLAHASLHFVDLYADVYACPPRKSNTLSSLHGAAAKHARLEMASRIAQARTLGDSWDKTEVYAEVPACPDEDIMAMRSPSGQLADSVVYDYVHVVVQGQLRRLGRYATLPFAGQNRHLPIPVARASLGGCVADVEMLLLERGCPPTAAAAVHSAGGTLSRASARDIDLALVTASLSGHAAVVELLLRHRAPDGPRKVLNAALFLACMKGNACLARTSNECAQQANRPDAGVVAAGPCRGDQHAIVEQLLQAGASVFGYQSSALYLACQGALGQCDLTVAILTATATAAVAAACAAHPATSMLPPASRIPDPLASQPRAAMSVARSLSRAEVRVTRRGMAMWSCAASSSLWVACSDAAGTSAMVDLLLPMLSLTESPERPSPPASDSDHEPSTWQSRRRVLILHQCMRCASAAGHWDIVDRLLSALDAESGRAMAPSREGPSGLTDTPSFQFGLALHQASEFGHVKVVDRLLRLGVIEDAERGRALMVASAEGHAAVVERLLDGARSTASVNMDDALICACRHGHVAVIECLLKAGADIHANLDAPLACAADKAHLAAFGLLVRRGALLASLDWPNFGRIEELRLLQCVPPGCFWALSDDQRVRWLRCHLRTRSRLHARLLAARDRLDRPPSALLASPALTREALIEQLRSAGRAFARDYWEHGIPIFFDGRLAAELGPLPAEFHLVRL